jgi:class 3 adenylate cyclase
MGAVMEPRIQYAKTADGVNIAYWTLGQGMPFVVLPPIPFSHVQLEWQVPEVRRFYERMAEKRQLVRYDGRGSGLSDRNIADYSLDAHVRDLDAVVDELGFDTFALFAASHGGPVAIAYTARHSERVSNLLLWHSYVRGHNVYGSPRQAAIRQLAESDWETYSETLTHQTYGWSEGEFAHRAAAFVRESTSSETYRETEGVFQDIDLTSVLSEVTPPVLVLHRREHSALHVDHARDLASGIPNARLALLEGTSWGPWIGDAEGVLRAIDEFLDEGEEAAATAAPSGLVTILFTDMEGSTTLTQRLGDAAAQEVLRTHNTIIRDALKAHDGSETKHTGDGLMASFSSASRALECSIAIQRAFAAHNQSADEPIRVRIGLNAGEPVAEDDPDGRRDLFGTAVQLAARICAHAEPEQILAPIVVRELAAGKRFLFADLGDVSLRGFDDPVRLFEVRWREEA